MTTPIQLIAGLANPGKEYEATRHNAGAWFVLATAQVTQATLRPDANLRGSYAKATVAGAESCYLFIPSTFMNHSGQAICAIANYYHIAPQAILIAHDDIDIPVGDIRLKFGGGHGGHNGLRDIIQHLGSAQFHRLRIGVGHPGNSKDVHDYVLHAPSKSDRLVIDGALEKAESVLSLIVRGEMQKAMQVLHTTP